MIALSVVEAGPAAGAENATGIGGAAGATYGLCISRQALQGSLQPAWIALMQGTSLLLGCRLHHRQHAV